MAPADGFEVDAEVLRTVAMELGGVAEQAHRNAAVFSGIQDAMNDQARGFDVMRAAAEVESSWQRAIQTQAARLAVDGDMLDLNAASYLAGEDRNVRGSGVGSRGVVCGSAGRRPVCVSAGGVELVRPVQPVGWCAGVGRAEADRWTGATCPPGPVQPVSGGPAQPGSSGGPVQPGRERTPQ